MLPPWGRAPVAEAKTKHGQRRRSDADHHRQQHGHDEGSGRLDRVHVDQVDPVEWACERRGMRPKACLSFWS